MIAVLGAVAFFVQGYNQSMMNGFTTLPTFLEAIPQVDTVHTKGATKAHNAKILGESLQVLHVPTDSARSCCRHFRGRLGPRCPFLPVGGRSTWSAQDHVGRRVHLHGRRRHPGVHVLSRTDHRRQNRHGCVGLVVNLDYG